MGARARRPRATLNFFRRTRLAHVLHAVTRSHMQLEDERGALRPEHGHEPLGAREEPKEAPLEAEREEGEQRGKGYAPPSTRPEEHGEGMVGGRLHPRQEEAEGARVPAGGRRRG